MENKSVGQIVIGISILLILIILMFNSALKEIVAGGCGGVTGHGDSCPMYDNVARQTGLSLIIAGVLFVVGIALFFTKPKERIIIKKVKEKYKPIDMSKLDSEEKKVVTLLQKENNAIFQKTLMEKLEMGKVKTTRLLNKLEDKGIIERKRRGMNNIVVLNR